MELTNNLLKITENARGEIGYLFLGFAIIIVFYSLLSTELKRRKLDKLKEAAQLINEGHRRVLAAQAKEE